MDKVWVVMRGEYSDRHICGIFSSEERAGAFAERFGEGFHEADVVAWELDVEDQRIPNGMNIYSVKLNFFTGDVWDCYFEPPDNYDVLDEEDRVFVASWGAHFEIYCLATDDKHAIKIANERFASYKIGHPNWFKDTETMVIADVIYTMEMEYKWEHDGYIFKKGMDKFEEKFRDLITRLEELNLDMSAPKRKLTSLLASAKADSSA
jgi:hypothetical protein